MTNRIADHLTPTDRSFLREINFIPPQPDFSYADEPPNTTRPGPLKPGWDRNDANELLTRLGLILFHQDHGGR